MRVIRKNQLNADLYISMFQFNNLIGFFLLCFCGLIFPSIIVAAEIEMIDNSRHSMISYLIGMDCSHHFAAKMEIRAKSTTPYKAPQAQLQKTINYSKAWIESNQCAAIRRINIVGNVNGKLVYAGSMEKSSGWKIISLTAPEVFK